jgi:hypothetical protein
MEILDFNPTVYRVQFESIHGLSTWDLLTVDGETPKETVYFMRKGNEPSYTESDKIIEAIENEEWEVIELSIRNFDSKIWEIDANIFETAGKAYSGILKAIA